MQSLSTDVEAIEYLKYMDFETLFNIYFVNKYFQNALECGHLLKRLGKIINLDCFCDSLYTFSDFVYACDHIYLTCRTIKYVNDSQKLLDMAAVKNDKLMIYNCLEKKANISHTFLCNAGKNKHYELIDLYHDRCLDYNICYSPGGYIDRNSNGNFTTKIIKRVKEYDILDVYRCIVKTLEYKQIELAKLLLPLTVDKEISNEYERVSLLKCLKNSMDNISIFDLLLKKLDDLDPDIDDYDYLLSSAISKGNERVRKFFLNRGLKYSTRSFRSALTIKNFKLCDKIYVELDIDDIVGLLNDEMSIEKLDTDIMVYLKNKMTDIDFMIKDHITFDNSDILLNMHIDVVDYYDILEIAVVNFDYKLLEKYLCEIHDQSKISDLFMISIASCKIIKIHQILYSRLNEIELRRTKQRLLTWTNQIKLLPLDIQQYISIIIDKDNS